MSPEEFAAIQHLQTELESTSNLAGIRKREIEALKAKLRWYEEREKHVQALLESIANAVKNYDDEIDLAFMQVRDFKLA